MCVCGGGGATQSFFRCHLLNDGMGPFTDVVVIGYEPLLTQCCPLRSVPSEALEDISIFPKFALFLHL